MVGSSRSALRCSARCIEGCRLKRDFDGYTGSFKYKSHLANALKPMELGVPKKRDSHAYYQNHNQNCTYEVKVVKPNTPPSKQPVLTTTSKPAQQPPTQPQLPNNQRGREPERSGPPPGPDRRDSSISSQGKGHKGPRSRSPSANRTNGKGGKGNKGSTVPPSKSQICGEMHWVSECPQKWC